MQYTLTVNEDGEGHVSFVSSDGSLVQVPHTHPNFPGITTALVRGDDPTDFLDAARAIRGLDDSRVVVEEGGVLFDGEPIHNKVADAILRYRNEGRDATNLVRFLERLQKNPSYHARDDLFRWVERAQLTIGEDGRIIAHKGVNVAWDPHDDDEFGTRTLQDVLEDDRPDWDEEGLQEAGYDTDVAPILLASSTAGTASVNGVEFVATLIPQWVGAVVSMPREHVDDDSGQACSAGLHIGSFGYARNFARRVIEVAVAPEDVVSVPAYETEKLRCCRYEVLALQPVPEPDLSRWEPERTVTDEPEAFDDALDEIAVPVPFRARLWDRLRGRG